MILKEEIKAVYGYGKVYSVPTVSRVDKLTYSSEHQSQGDSSKERENVKFADVLEQTMHVTDGELQCATSGYGRTGAYQEFIYFKREYRQ